MRPALLREDHGEVAEHGEQDAGYGIADRESDSAVILNLARAHGASPRGAGNPEERIGFGEATRVLIQIKRCWSLLANCSIRNATRRSPTARQELRGCNRASIFSVTTAPQSVSTTLPLDQFASVRKGAPAQTYQQDIDA
jgi:hypothetical protein